MSRIKDMYLYFSLLILAALKFIIFNIYTDNQGSLIFLTIVSLLYFAFVLYKLIKKPLLIFSLYSLFSFIMFCDLINYKYFNTYTSINSFGNINQLGVIKDTIIDLISYGDFILLIDLPIVFWVLHEIKPLDFSFTKRIYKQGINIVSGIMFLGIVINPFNLDSVSTIQNREIISYRAHDVYSYFIKSESKTDYSEQLKELEKSFNLEQGKYFGLGEKRNLIVIQVESMQNFVVNKEYEGKEITPNINKLINKDSFYFSNYYQQLGLGNTSDAEFITNNSIYPTTEGQAYSLFQNNEYYGLPWQLKEAGYETFAMHGHDKEFWNRANAYPAQGFDNFYDDTSYTIKEYIGYGLGDIEFFEQSVPIFKEIKKPFYAFMITLSSHNPYTVPEKYHTLPLNEKDKDTYYGDYLNSVSYTDRAIGVFIETLKANNLYENSIIAIYGDHFGLGVKDKRIIDQVENFIGKDYYFDEMLKIPLIIHIPGSGVTKSIDLPGGQVDFMPTIMNLMGQTNKNPYVFGKDLLNSKEGFVISQTYLVKGSFIKDNILFEMSRDGIFRNSKALDLNRRKEIDVYKFKEESEYAANQINLANYILENDLIRKGGREND